MGHITLAGKLMMAGLFAVMIIGFATNFAIDNDAAIDIGDNVIVTNTSNNLKSNLGNIDDQSNSAWNLFKDSTIKPGDENLESGGPFKTVTAMIGAVKNIFSLGTSTFGGSAGGISPVTISLTALGGFITFMFMLYIFKTWRGNPD